MFAIRETCLAETPLLADVLSAADREPRLHGYVAPEESNRGRLVVFVDGAVAGFMTPRLEGDHWRIGATYFYPVFRKQVLGYSLAIAAYQKFFHGKAVAEVVDKDNVSAKSFLKDCGLRFQKCQSEDTEYWSNFSNASKKGENKVAELPKLNHEALNAALQIVNEWDFTLTKQKLLEPGYAGWTQERADAAEQGYKRYLAITKALNGYQPVPNGDIDRFWHEHILDTRRYAKDCDQLLGSFLHHYPYFGMRGTQDNEAWKAASQFSNNVWKEAFGEYLYNTQNISTTKTNVQSAAASTKGKDMPVHISITINVNGTGVTTSVGTGTELMADAMKCPQACPNPGVSALGTDAMKCPQACPNPGTIASTDLAEEAMKCPQACPNPGASDVATGDAMKCPQACPNPGAES